MIKRTYLSAVFLLLAMFAFGQNYTIKGRIKDFPGRYCYIGPMYGDQINIKDTLELDNKKQFTWIFPENAPTGMYNIFFGPEEKLSVIFNKEDIEFETSYENPQGDMHILQSEENKIYYSFLHKSRRFERKMEILTSVLDYYPEEDDYLKDSRKQYERIQHEHAGLIEKISRKSPDKLAAKIIQTHATPFLKAELSETERIAFLKVHLLSGIDFNNEKLIPTNAYTNLAIKYLSLYASPDHYKNELEKEYIIAVDILLSFAASNYEVYRFLLEYMVGGFAQYHFEQVLDHIAENYSADKNCENEVRKTKLQKRLEEYKKLSRGNTAPDIVSASPEQATVRLSSLKNDYILVVFWASWCPHCTQLLPEIKAFFEKQGLDKAIGVYAVSLDEEKEKWVSNIKDLPEWIHVSDLSGWECPSADDYCVFATPSMFLLKNDRQILAKPVDMFELKTALKENKLIL